MVPSLLSKFLLRITSPYHGNVLLPETDCTQPQPFLRFILRLVGGITISARYPWTIPDTHMVNYISGGKRLSPLVSRL